MGRPRSFDEQKVVASAAELFVQFGYEATSVDDLVTATGLHRGSLYQAFGSKRTIFLAALGCLVHDHLPAAAARPDVLVTGTTLDLLLVAALELAPHDDDVRDLVEAACAALAEQLPAPDPYGVATLLGRRLLERTRTQRPLP